MPTDCASSDSRGRRALSLIHRVLARARRLGGSGLDHVIPPEIKHDPFYRAIIRIASTEGLTHVLEIGASSGAGSTEALVTGILANPSRPALHCIEVSAPRFESLARRYAGKDFVHCYRASSVPLKAFPSAAEVEAFHRSVDSKFATFPLQQVLGWLEQDIAYVASQDIPEHGIQLIKDKHGIQRFDAVLIDGSEFTGAAELREVYGARFILLDDICTYKNFENFRSLSNDAAYRLLETSEKPRNGYAVFERTSGDGAHR